MTTRSPIRNLRLAAGQTVAVAAVRGTRLAVASGRAWLTREDDERDFVLPAGRSFTCDGDEVLVVQMLAAGTLAIDAAGVRQVGFTQQLRGLFGRLRGALSPAAAPAIQF